MTRSRRAKREERPVPVRSARRCPALALLGGAAALCLVAACPSKGGRRDGAAPPPPPDDAAAPAVEGAVPFPDAAPVVPDARDATPSDAVTDARAGDAQVFPRRPSCTSVRTRVVNGDFETPGGSGATIPGWKVETAGLGTVTFEPVSGYAGTGGIGLRIPDDGAQNHQAVARQTLELDPHTSYTLRLRVAGDSFRPRNDLPFLFLISIKAPGRTWTLGPRKRDGTDHDYTSLSLDFTTGADGGVDVELRGSASGRFLVDDISVDCNTAAQRFQSEALVLNLYDDQVNVATAPVLDGVLANMDKVLVAMADLTGDADPRTAKQAAAASRSFIDTEPRGLPAVYGSSPTAVWAMPDYVPTTLALMLARNFDRPQWLFDDDFAELFVYHALETLNLRFGARPEEQGRAYRARFEARYRDAWGNGTCAEATGLVWKSIQLRDQVGWEPFKRTFRYFRALPATDLPASRFERVRRFHQKLGELAGMPALWDTGFTAQEKALLQARYAPPGSMTPPRRPSELPASTTSASLSALAWESATALVGTPSRNAQPNGCPLRTAAGAHPSALYAYPFGQHVFRLARGWKRFTVGYALLAQPPMSPAGSALFVIRGDGRELHRSPDVTDATPKMAAVDVTGVDRLELLILDALATSNDASVWIDPTITR
jgi:hypothetical protein